MSLLILMLLAITTKTHLPIQLYISIDAPIQKLSPFIFMYPFRITSTIYQSTQLLLYIHTDLPGNKYVFIMILSFWLTTKTYQ